MRTTIANTLSFSICLTSTFYNLWNVKITKNLIVIER